MRSQPRAVLFLTGFGVVGRNHDYISAVRERGLVPLMITGDNFRDEVEAARGVPGHIVHQIHEIAYARGRMDAPESFTADVVAVLERWEPRYEFAGVCAIGELLVEQVGLIADRYGLPGPGLRAARTCRSKYLQRWYLPAFAPRHEVVTPAARAQAPLAGLRYPVMVKPVSRHSSSGVAQAADERACRDLLAAYPEHEALVVEERVTGPEFSVEALVQHRSVAFASATAKLTTERTGGFTEIGHTLPYRGEHEKTLLAATHELLAGLDFQNGLVHAEWRIRESDGRPILMEVAARTPGDALLLLYKLATGASMEQAVVRICLGEPAGYPAPTRLARQVFVEHPAGAILRDVEYDGAEEPIWLTERQGQWPSVPSSAPAADPQLKALAVLVARDSALRALNSSDDRAVTFVIDGADEAALDAKEAEVTAALRLVLAEERQPARG